jgi:hypothetical protein
MWTKYLDAGIQANDNVKCAALRAAGDLLDARVKARYERQHLRGDR